MTRTGIGGSVAAWARESRNSVGLLFAHAHGLLAFPNSDRNSNFAADAVIKTFLTLAINSRLGNFATVDTSTQGCDSRFLFPRNSRAMAKIFTSRGISAVFPWVLRGFCAGFPCRLHKG